MTISAPTRRFGSNAEGLLGSEWTKLRSLRSTVWTLTSLVLVTVGFTALFTGLTVAQWDNVDPASKLLIAADPARLILGTGLQLGQLAVCVLGVLIVTSEYSSGTIRASLLAVPTRTSMLIAKCTVFVGLVFVIGEIAAFPAFFVGSVILRSHAHVSLSDPGVLRSVIGAGLYLALLGVIAIAVGTVVRHTAGAITGMIGFVLVLTPLTSLLPGTVGKHIYAYLPSEAGTMIASPRQGASDLLSPFAGFAVAGLWTVVLITIAGYFLRRRDA